MTARILFFILVLLVIFIPLYRLINFLFKHGFFIKSEDLVDELEKNKNKETKIHEEIKTKISILEKETNELKEVENKNR